jgi:hypothetical protein
MISMKPLFALEAIVAPPIDFGMTAAGQRRIVLVTGGTFSGDRIKGKLLLGGTDVQRIREDGVAELQIQAALETDDGDRILLNGRGVRYVPPEIAEQMARGHDPDPSSYYFREAITFETSSPKLAWLTRMLAVGTGRRTLDRVSMDVVEVL